MSSNIQSTAEADFTVTENAAKRIAFLLTREKNPQSKLRVSVDGGGCSGFQYSFDFVADKNEDDCVIEKNGAAILIDKVSMDFLKGSVLDYVETLGAAHFEVKNPNATASCGCGNSFSV